jgi:hypothetical protein
MEIFADTKAFQESLRKLRKALKKGSKRASAREGEIASYYPIDDGSCWYFQSYNFYEGEAGHTVSIWTHGNDCWATRVTI